MPDTTPSIVSKIWGMCNYLCDDGVSCQDYLRTSYNRHRSGGTGCHRKGYAELHAQLVGVDSAALGT